MKKSVNFFLCLIINFGCGQEIAVEEKETILEPNKTTTTFEYEIAHLNDTHAEVRNLYLKEFLKDFESYPI